MKVLELPEAANLAKQITETISGKKIARVTAGLSEHKFAFYYGDPADYDPLLRGKTIETVVPQGGLIEIHAGDAVLLFGDFVSLKYHGKGEQLLKKYQMLVEFGDDTSLSASVGMYGGLWCFREGEFDSTYYNVAREKPSPLADEFDDAYFERLISTPEVQKLSAKAFLATEQRIPGLGNGVLQDILYNAKIHPKRKMETLNVDERTNLFNSVKSTLIEMVELGGRDTEKDLFGEPGGYITKLGKNNLDKPCPVCGRKIIKQAYMGGIYFCAGCQKFP